MKQEKYLSEIAKIFGIRASALRYWESEGLLKFERNRENNYREPTMQNMLAVYDILFLRSLSIPVDKIRTCFASSLGEISDVFEENEQMLTRRIAELESSLVRLKKKSAAIRRICELRARGNACVYERLPAFHSFALSEQKSAREFVSEYERLGVCIRSRGEEPQFLVFEKNRFAEEKRYMSGLLSIDTATQKVIEAPEGSKIFGKYLVTATENGVQQDFYEAFAEIDG